MLFWFTFSKSLELEREFFFTVFVNYLARISFTFHQLRLKLLVRRVFLALINNFIG